MKKSRIVSLLMAGVLLTVPLAGCSSDGDKIKIGGLAPLSGEVSVYGIAADNGAKLAIKEINAAGGVLGKEIKYIVYDEKGDTTEATSMYDKLVKKDKVVALIGDVTSNPTIAVAEKAVADNLPMITPTGTAKAITEKGTNVVRACFIDPYQGEKMAAYTQKLGKTKAAILYNSSDDYSRGLTDSYVAKAGELGITIVAKEAYNKGDKDFRTQLGKIADSGAEVLFLPEYYEDIALIAAQAQEKKIDAILLGADGWDGVLKDGVMDKTKLSALKNAFFCNHYSAESTDTKVQNFIEAYKKEYNEEPNAFAALAYDAAYTLVRAIEKAGSTDKDAIIAALKDSDYKGVTGDIKFDENRNPIKQTAITTIQVDEDKQTAVYKYVETF